MKTKKKKKKGKTIAAAKICLDVVSYLGGLCCHKFGGAKAAANLGEGQGRSKQLVAPNYGAAQGPLQISVL